MFSFCHITELLELIRTQPSYVLCLMDQQEITTQSHLMKEPNLTPHVFDVLVKFRVYLTGLTADIEKAFHQIGIDPQDRDMLRFLWFDNVEDEHPKVIQYQFCRLVFGLTPSPAILSSVLLHHLTQGEGHESPVNKLLSESLYVDDFVGGATNDSEAFEIYQRACQVMTEAGFILRKRNTNSNTLKARINNDLKGVLHYGELTPVPELKILGLCWNTMSDELGM